MFSRLLSRAGRIEAQERSEPAQYWRERAIIPLEPTGNTFWNTKELVYSVAHYTGDPTAENAKVTDLSDKSELLNFIAKVSDKKLHHKYLLELDRLFDTDQIKGFFASVPSAHHQIAELTCYWKDRPIYPLDPKGDAFWSPLELFNAIVPHMRDFTGDITQIGDIKDKNVLREFIEQAVLTDDKRKLFYAELNHLFDIDQMREFSKTAKVDRYIRTLMRR